jgi:hypothetical protein
MRSGEYWTPGAEGDGLPNERLGNPLDDCLIAQDGARPIVAALDQLRRSISSPLSRRRRARRLAARGSSPLWPLKPPRSAQFRQRLTSPTNPGAHANKAGERAPQP